VPARPAHDPAATLTWARSHLRDLEDAYAAHGGDEQRIVATSLRFGVLCRFTAWLAVDTRVVTEGGQPHRVVQPVEVPRGWAPPPAASATGAVFLAAAAAPMAAGPMAGPPTVQARAARGANTFLSRAAAAPMRMARLAASRDDDALAQAGAQAREEVDRLRSAGHADLAQRREALADLGTRLAALIRHLEAAGVDDQTLTPVRELQAALADDAPLTLPETSVAQLWTRALEVLDALAAGPGARTSRKA
jgi:Ca-activated chloride channel family protein